VHFADGRDRDAVLLRLLLETAEHAMLLAATIS
jgi:hypothetical protein